MDAKAAWFRVFEGDQTGDRRSRSACRRTFCAIAAPSPWTTTLARYSERTCADLVKTTCRRRLRQALSEGGALSTMSSWFRCGGKKSADRNACSWAAAPALVCPRRSGISGDHRPSTGLAVENLRLVEQILRSHRQWSNTFDSIQDVVLLHDADFHIMKANHALLQRLAQAPADVMGKTCEAVLPANA